MHIDRTDLTILHELSRDARQSLVDLAAHIGLSTTAIARRQKSLEDAGVIQSYHLGLDLRQQMCQRAAQLWDVPEESVRYEEGNLSSGKHQISFKELAGKLAQLGASTGSVTAAQDWIDPQSWATRCTGRSGETAAATVATSAARAAIR